MLFSDRDKDYLLGLLERILKTNIILARTDIENTMNGKSKEVVDEAERFVNK